MTYSTLDSCPAPARLPVTNTVQKVPGAKQETTPSEREFVRFLSVQSEVSWSRLLHFSNDNQRPYDVILQWTGANGVGNKMRVTAGGGALVIPVQAKAMTVSIGNWTLDDMVVRLAIENGAPTTMDLRVVKISEALAGGATEDFAIPRYAREVLVQPDQSALVGNVVVRMLNQSGNTAAEYGGGEYVPVSAAVKLQVGNTGGVAFNFYTLDFKLGYQ